MGNRRWRELDEKYPWLNFYRCWPGKGIGRYWKRRLNKMRRKFAKACIAGRGRGHERGLADLESTVNWRTW